VPNALGEESFALGEGFAECSTLRRLSAYPRSAKIAFAERRNSVARQRLCRAAKYFRRHAPTDGDGSVFVFLENSSPSAALGEENYFLFLINSLPSAALSEEISFIYKFFVERCRALHSAKNLVFL
jgi:hypothetical protein